MEGSLCVFQNPNPTGIMSNITQQIDQTSSDYFQLSDCLMIQDYYNSFDQDVDVHLASQNMVESQQNVCSKSRIESYDQSTSRASNIKQKGRLMKNKVVDNRLKVAFRTKSKLEVMDDGYKWRKYGKKMVKNSPNPRNYFKCSNGGCNVKKRVERDRDDSSYVITTYDGVHNHECPSVVYHIPSMLPTNGWNAKEFFIHSSSS